MHVHISSIMLQKGLGGGVHYQLPVWNAQPLPGWPNTNPYPSHNGDGGTWEASVQFKRQNTKYPNEEILNFVTALMGENICVWLHLLLQRPRISIIGLSFLSIVSIISFITIISFLSMMSITSLNKIWIIASSDDRNSPRLSGGHTPGH